MDSLGKTIDIGVEGIKFLASVLEPVPLPATVQDRIAVAQSTLILEHHQAILLLANEGLHGSALALVRILFDTGCRALWVQKITDPVKLRKVLDDDKHAYPPFKEFTAGLDTHYDTDLFTTMKESIWNLLNSLTHSGMQQVHFRFGLPGKTLLETYTEEKVVGLLALCLEFSFIVHISLLDNLKELERKDQLLAWLGTHPPRDRTAK